MEFFESVDKLTLVVSADETETLKEWALRSFADDQFYDWMDSYLADTEYEWLDPVILGVRDDKSRQWELKDAPGFSLCKLMINGCYSLPKAGLVQKTLDMANRLG